MFKPTIPGAAPNEAPQLRWPSIVYTNAGVSSKDALHFPAEHNVYERHRESERGNTMRLVAFETAIMEAHRRLLVMDPHFDEVGVHALLDALEYSQANEIKFLTETDRRLATWRQELEAQINLHRTDHRVEVHWRQLKRDSFPFLHDRFAVVDDALWHFGATVGGGHRSVNAASGPWSAVHARAIDFFDECWRTLR